LKYYISLGILLMALWLLLSTHFEPLMISFGVGSVIFTLVMAKRMNLVDRDSIPIHMVANLIKFWLQLGLKILVSNVDVTLRILGLKPINPQLIKIPLPKSDDLSIAMYANAITLTPGSASLHIEDGYLYVHTISKEGAEELISGDMLQIIPHNKYSNPDEVKK
jgi:multicomponent Na+:H+ antiporter subunit E